MTAHALLVLPVLVPLVTAAVCALVRSTDVQRVVASAGAAGNLAACLGLLVQVLDRGILVTRIGNYPAPFGIAFAADRLSAAMVVAASLVAALVLGFAVPTLSKPPLLLRLIPLLNLLMAGLGGFFLTADLFNLYVWFELILVASFGLLLLGARASQVEGAAKYVIINVLGSTLLLTSIGLLYAAAGSLDFADLAARFEHTENPPFFSAVGALMLVALGIKAAAFPLFFWLPASYHTPPIAVTALFGGLLAKVGVYGMIRLFTLLFVRDSAILHTGLLLAAALTMLTGALAALAQDDLRRLLSFLVISEIGYMLMGLGLFSTQGVAATIFFALHVIVVTTGLFFVFGAIQVVAGSFRLHDLGNLDVNRPGLAPLFLLPALSLSGIPPLSGFIGKLWLVQAALDSKRYSLVAVALLVSLLTLYAMIKVWTQAFWTPSHAAVRKLCIPFGMCAPAAVLAALTVLLGVLAQPVAAYAHDAAQTLLDRKAYLHALRSEPLR